MSARDEAFGNHGHPLAITIRQVAEHRGRITREILDDLPEWFGIPAAVDAYVAEADTLPMLVCLTPDGEAIGFASLRPTSPYAVEIAVLGIKRAWHRQGIGRALIAAARTFAIGENARYLTVKTLAPSHPDEHYARTRAFYEAVGFVPIEEFPTLWGEENPCLFMLQPLQE